MSIAKRKREGRSVEEVRSKRGKRRANRKNRKDFLRRSGKDSEKSVGKSVAGGGLGD